MPFVAKSQIENGAVPGKGMGMNVPTATDGGLIDKALNAAPISRAQIAVAFLCAIIAMLDGFDTQALAFVAPVVGAEWGIPPERLGIIFSAGLVGIMVGQIIVGPLSDKWGRRPVILASTFLFGLLCLATVLVQDWEGLLVLRFLTGIGLGGATPNLIALTSEIAPPRARATMITAMFAGFPLGAAIGGYLSSILIPALGWKSVFVMGGALPLLLLPPLYAFLPESPHFLLARDNTSAQLTRVMQRLLGTTWRSDETPAVPDAVAKQSGTGFSVLLSSRFRPTTLLLWLAYFNSLLMIYFLMSWLPTIARQTGLALDFAIYSAVLLNLGGALGGVFLGRAADRLGAFRTLACSYAIAGICLGLLGFVTQIPMMLMALAFLAGLCTIGGQTAMNAAAAALYPASVRATGLGAALAIGRTGSVLGPWIGGLLLARGGSLGVIFAIVAVPAILTAIIATLLHMQSQSKDRS